MKLKYWILMGLCKATSALLATITLGIPQLIKLLNKLSEEYEAKANGKIEPEQGLQLKHKLEKYHVVIKKVPSSETMIRITEKELKNKSGE